MKRFVIGAFVAIGLCCLPACGGNPLREANLSEPVVTDDGTVWWAEHRAREYGDNDTRIIMCRRGETPVCVRTRPHEYQGE